MTSQKSFPSCSRVYCRMCIRKGRPLRGKVPQPQKLRVSMLLPGTSSAAEWRDLLQSRRQFWRTLTTRHASLVPVSAEALQRERRQMQAKHLWYNVDKRWSDLKDKLEVLAPTGLTRERIFGGISSSQSSARTPMRRAATLEKTWRMSNRSGKPRSIISSCAGHCFTIRSHCNFFRNATIPPGRIKQQRKTKQTATKQNQQRNTNQTQTENQTPEWKLSSLFLYNIQLK